MGHSGGTGVGALGGHWEIWGSLGGCGGGRQGALGRGGRPALRPARARCGAERRSCRSSRCRRRRSRKARRGGRDVKRDGGQRREKPVKDREGGTPSGCRVCVAPVPVSRQARSHAVLGASAPAGHRCGPVDAAAEYAAALREGQHLSRIRARVGGVWARPGPDPRPPRVSTRVRGFHGVHAPHQTGCAAENHPRAEGQDDQGGEVHAARPPQGQRGAAALSRRGPGT